MAVIQLHPRQLPLFEITGSGLYLSASQIIVGEGNGLIVSGSSVNLILPGTISSSAVNRASGSHTHALNIFNNVLPVTILPDASGSIGSSSMAARLDHIHPISTATGISLSGSSTNGEGASTSFARADHWHEIASYSDVSTPISAIIKSDASGDIKVHKIEATEKITVPYIDTNVGASLSIVPDQDLNLTPSGSRVRLTTGVRIQSDDYVSQTTGWGISYAGSGDFRYLYADELHARAFIADLEAVRAGVHGIFPSASVLASDFIVPAAGASATLIVDSFKGFDTFRVFLDNDIVNIRQFDRSGCSLDISNCYGSVTWVSTDTTNKIQTYTFIRSASPNSGAATVGATISAGATVPDYGISGNGFIESNAIDGYRGENSPYTQIVSWTVHPHSGKVVNNRLGNLYGIFASFGEYGMYAGTGVTDDSNYLRISNQFIEAHNLPVRLYSSSSRVMALEPSSYPYMAIGYPIPTGYLSQNGVWFGKSNVDDTYKMYVGTVSGSALLKGWSWDGSNLYIRGNVVVGDGAIGYGINVGDAYLVNRFDGPQPYESDYTGDLIGHKGQVPIVSGGTIFRSGKFGKALQLAEGFQNEIDNPSFEVNLTGWTISLGSGSLLVDTTKSLVGQSCLKIIAGSATNVSAYTLLSRSIADGETICFSGHIWQSGGSIAFGDMYLYDVTNTTTRSIVYPTIQNQWQRISGSWLNDTGDSVNVRIYVRNRNMDSSTIVWFDGIQAEVNSYVTPYGDGSLGVGHAWSGTAHNSVSTRANAVFNYSTISGSNIINLNSGTFMCWYYNDNINTGVKRLATAYIGAGDHLSIFASSSAAFTPYAVGSSGSTSVGTSSGATTAGSGWNHLAVTWTTGSLIVYLNGVQSGTIANYVVPMGVLETFWLGQTQASTAFLNGLIDEVVILPTALSSQEIKSVYQSNVPVIVTTSVNSIYLRGTRETGYIRGNAYGLLGYSSTSGSNNTGSFALITSDGVNLGTEFGSPSLNAGDILFGSVGTNQVNLLYDRSEGTLSLRNDTTSLINLNASGYITVGNISTEHIFIDSGSVQIKDGASVYTNLVGGVLTLGVSSNDHLIVSSSAVYIKAGDNIYTNLTSGSLILGLASSGEYISIDPNNGLRMYGSGNLNGQWLNNGDITLGYVATNKANVFWDVSEGTMSFRGGTDGIVSNSYIGIDGSFNFVSDTSTPSDPTAPYNINFVESVGGTIVAHLGTGHSTTANYTILRNKSSINSYLQLFSETTDSSKYTSVEIRALDSGIVGGDTSIIVHPNGTEIWNHGLYIGEGLASHSPGLGNIWADGGIYLGRQVDPGIGNLHFTGSLISYKGTTEYTGYIFVPLTVPLISTSWDGDSFSTTAKTLIDLSTVFGAPAGIKAVKVYVGVRDSDSAGTDTYLVLGPTNDSGSGIPFSPLTVNDRWYRGGDDIPCDSNGDIYYQIGASGVGTFDVILQIWGYYI